MAGLTDGSLRWKMEQICFSVTSIKLFLYLVPLFSYLKKQGDHQDILCKSSQTLRMKRLGKRYWGYYTPHPLLSVLSQRPLPPSTAGFTPIRRHYSQQLSCLGADTKGGHSSTVGGDCPAPLWWLMSPKAGTSPACPCTTSGARLLLGLALSTACSSTFDTKSRRTAISWGQRSLLCQGNIAKHPKIPQELTYH